MHIINQSNLRFSPWLRRLKLNMLSFTIKYMLYGEMAMYVIGWIYFTDSKGHGDVIMWLKEQEKHLYTTTPWSLLDPLIRAQVNMRYSLNAHFSKYKPCY